MSVKIFTNTVESTETWTATGALFTWAVGKAGSTNDPVDSKEQTAKGGHFPLMLSNLQLSYSRQFREIPSVIQQAGGVRKRIRIAEPPKGELRVTSLFSPSATTLQHFITAVSKDCKTAEEQVTMWLNPFGGLSCKNNTTGQQSGTPVNNFGKIMISGVDLSVFGLQIQAGEGGAATIALPLVFEFSSLDWDVK